MSKGFVAAGCRAFGFADFHYLFPRRVIDSLAADLSAASESFVAKQYANFTVACAVALLAFSLFCFALFVSPLFAVVCSFIVGIASLAALLKYPAYLASLRAREFESDLPAGLKAVQIELQAGSPFERALESACSGYGVFSCELSKCVAAIRCGVPVGRALQSLSLVRSPLAARAAGQFAFEYAHGGRGDGLGAIADEALSKQHALARQYGAKLSFYSVVFVGVSAVLPSLFSAYLIISSSFLEIPFSRAQIVAAYVVLFPLLSLSIAAYAKSGAPRLLSW